MNKQILALLAAMLFVAPILTSCTDTNATPEPGDAINRKYDVLAKQVQYWTDTEVFSLSVAGHTDAATVHLTYISPQLIDAATEYTLAIKGISGAEAQTLRDEVRRRLQEDRRIPFILTVQPTTTPNYRVEVGLPESLSLYTVSGSVVLPVAYDRIFDVQFGGTKGRSGYVFFPYLDTSHRRVNLDQEPSLTVKMNDFRFIPNLGDLQEWGAELAWNFNLVPAEFQLQSIQKPDAAPAKSLSANELTALVGAVLTVVNMYK